MYTTLIDSGLLLYRRFVRPMPPDEQESYYRDGLLLAEMFGLGREAMPPDIVTLQRYVKEIVSRLEVSDEARAIADELFRPMPPALASL